MVTSATIALFDEYRKATSSGKLLEHIDNACEVWLLYNLSAVSKNSKHLPIAFDESSERHKKELTDKRQSLNNGRLHMRTFRKTFLDKMSIKEMRLTVQKKNWQQIEEVRILY